MAAEPARRAPAPAPGQAGVPLRSSLRLRVHVAAALALFVPQVLVAGWLAIERSFASAMLGNAEFCAAEAARAVGSAAGPEAAAAIAPIAEAHRARIRLVDPSSGALLADADHDQGRDFSQRIGAWLLGAPEGASLDGLDADLGPVASRPEIAAARAAPASGCRSVAGATVVVCHAARSAGGGRVVHAEDAAARPAAHLSYLGFVLPRLAAATLPFALLLAWWMGRTIARPVEQLRRQALQKAGDRLPRGDLEPTGPREIRDLAGSFNALLAALEARRGANEAFVADLVHELKNPVSTVRACAEALARGPADERRSARLAALLEDSSARLDGLVSQFLELARAEAGMQHEARSRVDLAALVRGVAGTMAEDPRFSGVSLRVQTDGAALVEGVPHRLESVVRNLLENAASFAGEGGEVRASVRAGGVRVALRVSDDGPGIADEDLPRVFDRFFTTRGGGSGTGLGLALVRAIVEAHGGSVEAISPASPDGASAAAGEAPSGGARGRGATFVVDLPRAGSESVGG